MSDGAQYFFACSILSNAIKVTSKQIGFGCVVCTNECHYFFMHTFCRLYCRLINIIAKLVNKLQRFHFYSLLEMLFCCICRDLLFKCLSELIWHRSMFQNAQLPTCTNKISLYVQWPFFSLAKWFIVSKYGKHWDQ